MNVTILYGFLGAGKTTLLRGLLPELAQRGRVAVLVNEFGDVGIDGAVLSTGELQVKEIASGCVCCALQGDLVRALVEIHERWNPDRLIIEPTGVAAPQPLAQVLASRPVAGFVNVDRVIAVVDAPRFLPSREVFSAFYTEQIRQADAIVLNKVDRATPEVVADVAAALREANPTAPIEVTTFCRVPSQFLEGDGRRVTEDGGLPSHEHAHDSTCGIKARVVPVGPTTRAAIEGLVRRLDAGEFGHVVRAKGFLETAEGMLHLEYVPGEGSLEKHEGAWPALVVAGRDMDADGIARALRGDPPAEAPGASP